jgi:hypothetical protein
VLSIPQTKVWRGFYIFGVDPQAGFTLKGTMEHFNDQAILSQQRRAGKQIVPHGKRAVHRNAQQPHRDE